MMSNEFKVIPHLEVFSEEKFSEMLEDYRDRLSLYHTYHLRTHSVTEFLQAIVEIGRDHPDAAIDQPLGSVAAFGVPNSGHDASAPNAWPNSNGPALKTSVVEYKPPVPGAGLLGAYVAEIHIGKTQAEINAEVEGAIERLRTQYEGYITDYAARKREHYRQAFLETKRQEAEEAARLEREREELRILAEADAYAESMVVPATAKKPRKSQQEVA